MDSLLDLKLLLAQNALDGWNSAVENVCLDLWQTVRDLIQMVLALSAAMGSLLMTPRIHVNHVESRSVRLVRR